MANRRTSREIQWYRQADIIQSEQAANREIQWHRQTEIIQCYRQPDIIHIVLEQATNREM